MAFPKVSDWSEKAYSASARGFNFLVDFEREMHKVYEDTRPFTFGFFSEDDINYQTTVGWRHLKASMWDVEDWNSVVGLRFGVRVDAENNVLYNNNYIMLMPREYRETVVLPDRLAAIKRMEQQADEDRVWTHPSDKVAGEMKEDLLAKTPKTEKAKVQVKGTPPRGEAAAKTDDDNW